MWHGSEKKKQTHRKYCNFMLRFVEWGPAREKNDPRTAGYDLMAMDWELSKACLSRFFYKYVGRRRLLLEQGAGPVAGKDIWEGGSSSPALAVCSRRCLLSVGGGVVHPELHQKRQFYCYRLQVDYVFVLKGKKFKVKATFHLNIQE